MHSAGGLVAGGLFEVSPENCTRPSRFMCTRFSISAGRLFRSCGTERGSNCSGFFGGRDPRYSHKFAYQVVKGIAAFTRALARVCQRQHPRQCVAPGVIRTRFHANMSEQQKKLNLNSASRCAEGTPEQVAR